MYIVIKEYFGIEKGTEVNSNKKTTRDKMVANGFWKKIEPIKAKVEPTKRLKKIEPGLAKRKKK